ncbi:MAG: thioredoxin family protein [Acidobacteriota bacterium]
MLQRTSSNPARGLALALLLVLVAPAAGAQSESDAIFRNFQPSGDFSVTIGGETFENVELYHAEQAGAYLLIGPELSSPLLINTRTRLVEQISLLKVAKRDSGIIDLLADASFESLGPFAVGSQQLSFEYKGKKVVMEPKPPLLGLQKPQSLVDHNPAYGFKSDQYTPDGSQLARLREEGKDVRVRIYFGNWCPVCSRLVPKVLKVQEGLADSKINFEYYGMPRPMSDDPISTEQKINGVPTGVVYVNGVEKGRLNGRDLYKPEASIARLLQGS